jgi:cytochrome c oxidase subunit 4
MSEPRLKAEAEIRPERRHPIKVGHVVPWWLLVAVWGGLIILTWLTVAATYVDLGKLNLVLALAIATVKAYLVALYFMHLRWDRPFNGLVFLFAILFVMLFVGFALLDTLTNQPELIPGYAPAMEAAQ